MVYYNKRTQKIVSSFYYILGELTVKRDKKEEFKKAHVPIKLICKLEKI